MRTKTFIILLFTLMLMSIKVEAQLINDGWAFTDKGSYQKTEQCFIDKVGNRFVIVISTGDFTIDSSGFPITIKRLPNIPSNVYSTILIKYDIEGNYLYNLQFENTISNIAFSKTNDLYCTIMFRRTDSLNLYNINGDFFKTIYSNYKLTDYDSTAALYHQATVLCKLNTNGQYIWDKTISQITLRKLFASSTSINKNPSITVNENDEVSCFFPCNRLKDYGTIIDTITIKHSSGKIDSAYINTQDIICRFSASGNTLSVSEPLKNLASYSNKFVLSNNRFYKSVTDGYNNYSIFSTYTTQLDTFWGPNAVPLENGNNYLLIKTDQNDNLVWSKLIMRSVDTLYTNTTTGYNINLDYNSLQKELVLCMTNKPYYFINKLNPTSSSTSGSYLAKIDVNGNIVWDDLYTNYNFVSFTYNYVSKQYLLVGYRDVISDNRISAKVSTSSYLVVAYLDSMNQINSAQGITSNISTINYYILTNFDFIGYPITDLLGRSYIAGNFIDSILLSCNILRANIEQSKNITDGFLLMLGRGTDVPRDTLVCKKMLSPSGKYSWDSTGTYYDTLINQLGCDSIVLFNLKILNSSSTKDSVVCKNFISPSGNYIWDSTGTYIDTVPNQFGCDSIITFNITIKQTQSILDTTVRYGYLSPSGNHRWDSTGIYTDTIVNDFGCDSIITIRLLILLIPTPIDTTVCDSFISPSGKYKWDTTGVYFDTLSVGNYDSILKITLTIQKINLQVSKTNDIDCDSTDAILEAKGAINYVWSPSTWLSNTQIFNPKTSPEKTIWYFVKGTDDLGCEAKDSIEIFVNKFETIGGLPNVFTPNNDGLNDCFVLTPVCKFKEVSFEVFNRWGILVFSTNDPNNCWNGKVNNMGEEVVSGVYFYQLNGVSNCLQKINLIGSITVFR